MQYFHGTRALLQSGELLQPGFRSIYRPEVTMNHIYFTELVDGAALAAEIAVMLGGAHAVGHVYEVEPTGEFEDDPNVTDKKFPGNPTRSFRSTAPLRILREVPDWTPLTPEARELWSGRLQRLTTDPAAQIIN